MPVGAPPRTGRPHHPHHSLGHGYRCRLAALLPEDWGLHPEGIWLHAHPLAGTATPAQGFKVHLSSTLADAERVLAVATPVCVAAGVGFKVVGDPGLHRHLDAKEQSRGSSGKFMTIYPPSLETFRELIEALHRATAGMNLSGPRILSDRPYRDSALVHYRYGGFRRMSRVEVDGRHTSLISSPAGEPVPDERVPYFRLPSWVGDPFGGSDEVATASGLRLGGRYDIEEAIRFSNSGGVYRGTDTTSGTTVVIKEARPHTHPWGDGGRGGDAVDLLRREHGMLVRLGPTGVVPAARDLFEDAGHLFLVQEHLPGVGANRFWATDERVFAPYARRPGRVEAWVPTVRRYATALLDVVERVHATGVVLGDLSPGNVLVDPASMTMHVIDVETAVTRDEDPEFARHAAAWGTPGFLRPGRRARGRPEPEDDLYAAGMLLMASVLPICPFFALDPGAESRVLDRYVALGVPTVFRDVVRSLLAAEPGRARELLATWRCDPGRGA